MKMFCKKIEPLVFDMWGAWYAWYPVITYDEDRKVACLVWFEDVEYCYEASWHEIITHYRRMPFNDTEDLINEQMRDMK